MEQNQDGLIEALSDVIASRMMATESEEFKALRSGGQDVLDLAVIGAETLLDFAKTLRAGKAKFEGLKESDPRGYTVGMSTVMYDWLAGQELDALGFKLFCLIKTANELDDTATTLSICKAIGLPRDKFIAQLAEATEKMQQAQAAATGPVS